jgi:hypothetical protein
VEVLELLFVFEEDVGPDEGGALGFGSVVEGVGEFKEAFGPDGGFEAGDAKHAPERIGNGLDKSFLFDTDGF